MRPNLRTMGLVFEELLVPQRSNQCLLANLGAAGSQF